MLQLLRYLWASPWSAVGLMVGALALASCGRVQQRGRVLEFYGGAVSWLLRWAPGTGCGAAAMTLGHVVLGQSATSLDRTRAHELVHVRQYERWGPLFVPAYLLCSAFIYLRGGDGYRDNPFEREAFDLAAGLAPRARRERRG
ncbi:MAG TPA: hypothetical protein VF175_02950 [Lacipirellula sp.]